MRLNNNDLNSMVRRTDTMNDRTQAACLGIVRSASALTGTSAFSGQSANQLKAYLAQVTIRAAGELRELSQETVDLSRQIENTFLQIEPRQNGIVDRQTLTDIQRNLAQHQSSFNRTRDRVNALNRRADRHISASQITGNAVNNSFGRTTRFVDSSLTRIADADRSLQNRAQNLLQRIERFNATLRSINRLSVAADSFNMAKAIGLAVGFSQSGNIAFLMQMLEDPFVRKWLATSYSKWSRLAEMLGVEYETFFARSQRGFDNGVFSWGGEAGVFRGGTSQDIGPFELQGLMELLTASGFMHAGANSDFIGTKGAFDLVGLRAGGSMTGATENFTSGAGLEGSVLGASGSFQAYRRGENDFALGARGSVAAAEAGSTVRGGLFPFQSQGTDRMGNPVSTERNLLSYSLTGSVGVGVSGGGGIRSEPVTTIGPLNLNAVTIDARGKIPKTPASMKAEITVPGVSIPGVSVARSPLSPLWLR